MRATARRLDRKELSHDVSVRGHHVMVDEPRDQGGDDNGPDPQELLAASLASCTAITMEMYAKHKGWDIGDVEVQCEYTPAERGCPTKFSLDIRLASDVDPDRVEKLRIIAAKCPVHRTLDGEVMFEEKVQLVTPASA
jgi:putative redox protein